MTLHFLDIAGFRNLVAVKLQPISHGFNFIYGDNGSGKTSLLEAIYYLSLGRSFRSHIVERVIHHSEDKLGIFAHVALNAGQQVPIGLERHAGGDLKLRMNGKDVYSIAELANLLPVQLIDTHCHHLLDAGPAFRRKYLDWGIFYLNKSFLQRWRLYDRALKQRNAALRGQLSKKELDSWSHELIDYAQQLDTMRREYVGRLIPVLEQTIAELLSIADIQMTYYPGWDRNYGYAEILQQSIDRDCQLGYTQYGPHKADLKVMIKRVPAKDILSRGQQKLFVCAMIMARGAILQSSSNIRPIYLVDDLPSELDVINRTNLLALLSRQEAQVFITAVERNSCDNFITNSSVKMFHVEHGIVRDVFSNVE